MTHGQRLSRGVRTTLSLAIIGALVLMLPRPDDAPAQAVGGARPSGVYALQALLEFDSLEGAQFDPATRTLVLFGSRARADRFVPVDYLDLLAAALDSMSPTFSLEWTQESHRQLAQARQDRRFPAWQDDRITELGAWLFGQVGIRIKAGDDTDVLQEPIVKAGGVAKLFANRRAMHVPQELVPAAFDGQPPRARPVVKGMAPRSALAHVALAADVQAKRLIEAPDLAKIVPGYQTYGDWERVRGLNIAATRVWLSPERFEIHESGDGVVMRFQRSGARINLEKYVDGRSTPDPALTDYGQLLTARYDALAAHFPALHELREAYKVLAVAAWLKRHRWAANLPKDGRGELDMPAEIVGVTHVIVTVTTAIDRPRGFRLEFASSASHSGGVDLRVDDVTVVKLPSVDRLPVISPFEHTNGEIQRLMGKKIDVPSPYIPGWVAQAKGGQKALHYVAVQTEHVSGRSNAAELQQQLERVRQKARMLDYYDKIINATSAKQSRNITEITRLRKEVEDRRVEYVIEVANTLSSVAIAGNALRRYTGEVLPRRRTAFLVDLSRDLDSARDVFLDGEAGLERRESSADFWARLGERATDVGRGLERALNSRADFGPDQILDLRSNLVAKVAWGVGQLGLKFIDLKEMRLAIEDVDRALKSGASDLKQVQTTRQRYFDDYKREVQKYEAMLKR